jgi:hypothetical protein
MVVKGGNSKGGKVPGSEHDPMHGPEGRMKKFF